MVIDHCLLKRAFNKPVYSGYALFDGNNVNLFCVSGENERAATYCHSTLQRQLKLNQFSPMEWALNAATLSQYYITKV